MMKSRNSASLLFAFAVAMLLGADTSGSGWAQPTPAATKAFDLYTAQVEARLAQQHRLSDAFLAGPASSPQDRARLRAGNLIIENLTPQNAPAMPGAMLHHWRGTAFAPGAKAADFERLMRNFAAYPRVYAPQVMSAEVLSANGNRMQAAMRVEQKHVITVVMDTDYDIVFGQLDASRGYSVSRSAAVKEIASPGTPSEHPLGPGEEHGFLWRINTYWSYEERDDGLYLQVESITMTRSIPVGFGWAVGPFVESVPRESLEFTLRATSNVLRR